jgi:hypothetical protein
MTRRADTGRVFVYDSDGESEGSIDGCVLTDPSDFYSLIVTHVGGGKLRIKIAVQTTGSAAALRDWIATAIEVDQFELEMSLPPDQVVHLCDALGGPMPPIPFVPPARPYWQRLSLVLAFGAACGTAIGLLAGAWL